jgi:hypothetical protein
MPTSEMYGKLLQEKSDKKRVAPLDFVRESHQEPEKKRLKQADSSMSPAPPRTRLDVSPASPTPPKSRRRSGVPPEGVGHFNKDLSSVDANKRSGSSSAVSAASRSNQGQKKKNK